MITLFSIPKPFAGLDAIHQLNAIQSWTLLNPHCEIILCGDDPSVVTIAQKLKVRSLTGIEYTRYGTPLLNSVFSKVYEIAENPVLCYVNSDIILMDDFIESIARIKLKKYLAVGQRINAEINNPIDFDSSSWKKELLRFVTKTGKLYSVDGMDYFVFTRNTDLHIMPPFIVGRPRWDNWFVFNARNRKIPVIDLTRVTHVIHQNHGYAHVPHGQRNSWDGPETQDNMTLYDKLVGPENHSANIHDATHILTRNYMIPAMEWHYLFRRFQRTALYRKRLHGIAKLSKKWIQKKTKRKL